MELTVQPRNISVTMSEVQVCLLLSDSKLWWKLKQFWPLTLRLNVSGSYLIYKACVCLKQTVYFKETHFM